MTAMIEANQLCKNFKDKAAVRSLSFSVEEGEIFGLLGHNGAGKTTTIRLLTGQILPTSGQCSVAGFNSATEQSLLKPIIGVVSETQNLYERMTAFENLALFAHLYGVKKKRVDEMLEFVNLQNRSKDKVETFSNGMKQRLLIARALLHKPDVIFLDEPSRGLDPTSAKEIRNAIKDLANSGATVFLTTHNMEEADDLCHRVAFIKNGELIALDSPQNLKLQHGKRMLSVTFANQENIVIPLMDGKTLSQFFAQLDSKEIQTIHSQEATLEDVFINLAGREMNQ